MRACSDENAYEPYPISFDIEGALVGGVDGVRLNGRHSGRSDVAGAEAVHRNGNAGRGPDPSGSAPRAGSDGPLPIAHDHLRGTTYYQHHEGGV